MKYRTLGRTALRVSELCLGTMNFGPRTEEAEAFAILDAAVDAGINFVDTADQYGGELGVGTTETILGRWIAKHPDKRARLVLASKCHEPMSDDVNDRGLSARHITRACEASLRRLGVDHIELYQMHHIDRVAHVDEIWQAMDLLVAQGKISYVGSSNFPGWALAQANERAQARGRLGIVSEQGLYNLTERRAELEVIPACEAYGIGLIPWSPLAGGLLALGGEDGDRRRRAIATRDLSPERASALQQFGALAAEIGETSSAVSLAWLLRRPAVAATIIGPGSTDQLVTLLHVPDLILEDATLARIDAIFPPCGAAPEAYAW